MKDLSLHLLDILENSAKAGATMVTVDFNWSGTTLQLCIVDNGPGFAPAIRDDPTDPFRTTRTERKVGIGLSLLRAAAEQTGGHLGIEQGEGGGAAIAATFDFASIDAKPLGDVAAALATAVAAWPRMDVIVRIGPNRQEAFNTVSIRHELDGIPFDHPNIQKFLMRQLGCELASLTEWADSALDAAGSSRRPSNARANP